MSEWQSIESAPKDGSRVLLFDRQVYIGYWRDEADFGNGEAREGWQIFACDDDYWYAAATDNATHWMPLPGAP